MLCALLCIALYVCMYLIYMVQKSKKDRSRIRN